MSRPKGAVTKIAQLQPEPSLVDLKEACRILSVGKSTLYGLIADKQLRSVKLGKRRLIPVAEVRRLAAGDPLDVA